MVRILDNILLFLGDSASSLRGKQALLAACSGLSWNTEKRGISQFQLSNWDKIPLLFEIY